MKMQLAEASIIDIKSDLIVVNLFEGVKEPKGATGALDEALEGLISKYVIEQEKFEGKFGELYVFPTYGLLPANKVMVAGLGKEEDFNYGKIRILSSKIAKKALSIKAKKVSTIVHGAGIGGLNPFKCAQMIAEGVMIGSYEFNKYKSEKGSQIEIFEVVENNKEIVDEIKRGLKLGKNIGEAVNFARDMVNEPAGVITPKKVAEIARGLHLETKILDREEVKKLNMGAYLAVAQGSDEEPKFIHLKYSSKNKNCKKLAIIGKGITFDSGGLDLKPADSMRNMKDDMSGAAALLGIMSKIKDLNPDVEIHGIIASCENMPSGKAYKPGDILKAMNGKTIEIDNTDAEGRLTLADAICYAESLGVDEIIDIATLTGACMVALGQVAAGIMGNNQEMIDKLIKCAEEGGEKFWQLPLFEEYKDSIKSDVADMRNSGGRYAGASSAGLFLKEFVSKAKWTHIDIAGPAFISTEINELGKGATGVGVRSLINYILS